METIREIVGGYLIQGSLTKENKKWVLSVGVWNANEYTDDVYEAAKAFVCAHKFVGSKTKVFTELQQLRDSLMREAK